MLLRIGTDTVIGNIREIKLSCSIGSHCRGSAATGPLRESLEELELITMLLQHTLHYILIFLPMDRAC
jgi:hypothetical protein